ncbi:MAG: hypothetical protein D6761_02920 [Candidatus Dadabacteria bacterium]|nr:MAG: hypothetical protein D6761_02920 [Candidatus Dadabacteria bacterium]
MTTTLNGIVTGLDTQAIIDAALEAQSYRLDNLVQQQREVGQTRDRIDRLDRAFDDLRNSIEPFAGSAPLALSATSGNESLLGVSATSGAQAGSWTVNVIQTARGNVLQGSGYANATDTVGSGTLSVTVGGTTTDLTVSAGTTLEQLRDQINNADLGVQATLINTGSGATPWTLVLASENTGTANAVSVDTSAMSGGPAFSEIVAARDAQIELNGVAITRATNTIDDAIAGVTLELTPDATGSTTITVDTDADTMKERIQAFVDAYNDVRGLATDASDGSKGNVDAGLRLVGDRLQQAFFSTPPAGTVAGWFDLGLQHGKDGKLQFDSARFDETLASNPDAVTGALHAGDGSGLLEQIDNVVDLTDGVGGTLDLREQSLDRQDRSLDDAIADEQARLDALEASMRARFATMESMVAQLNASGLMAMFGTPQS